jgi:hypothetical protein
MSKVTPARWWNNVNYILLIIAEVLFFWLLDKLKGRDSVEIDDNDYNPDGE